ncbi:ABC transporter ATP-binding protein [Salinisphaera sp. T31B1]|uniref:ABC transporter ATP-binding protein n=1 Tax=Salinisphaera sp. T31B1 TaxID=727963 RepID=UPI0033402C9E
MHMVELKGVSKAFGDVDAVSNVDLTIREGEFVTLLGPSGSGKTTLLNLIAGMATPSAGRIEIRGRDVTHSSASERDLGMVFQNYALMPHMSVFENIAFPLRVRRLSRQEIERKVNDVLDLVQLPQIKDRKPRELSGGQQQRVALARCIVYNPALILLDEPLGALDKKLREYMQLEIRRVHAELGITMLNVTHDQDEALTMSDRIVLMNQGRIEQQDTPEQLYFRPKSVFAADFIGTANLVECEVSAVNGDRVRVTGAAGAFEVTEVEADVAVGDRVTSVIRPENVEVRAAGDDRESTGSDNPWIEAVVKDSLIVGGVVRHYLTIAGDVPVVAQQANSRSRLLLSHGDRVSLRWAQNDCRIIAC